MTELLLMRHGKSNQHLGLPDDERPLTDRGKRDAQRMGEFLRDQQLVPDLVICSPAKRALTTAKRCVQAMGLAVDSIHTDSRIYDASIADLYNVIEDHGEGAQRLLVVGHNPGMEMFVETLIGDDPFGSKGMTTANVAYLRLDEQGKRRRAELISVIRPADLR